MVDSTLSAGDALRFCHLSTFYPPFGFGGDAVQVQCLATALARHGHKVRVVHNSEAYRMLGGEPASSGASDPSGVEVIAVPSGPLAKVATAGTYATGSTFGYRRRLEELTSGWDVVHLHNPSLLGGPGAFGMGGKRAVRLYTTYEHWLVCPTHVLFRFGREPCEKRTCWRCSVSYGRPPQPWRSTGLMTRAVARLDVVLAPSHFTAGIHRAAFPETRVEVLRPPVVAAPSVESRTAGKRPGRPLFVFAGRLEPIKGADRLTRAFSGVRGADLVIAGTGSQEPTLRALAELDPNIRMAGHLGREDVLDLISSATAVVVPSVGYETFGGVAAEAMLLGTPVVVRELGPLPELVENGGGLLFDDDRSMVDALQSLVDEPSLGTRLGEEARQTAARRFSEASYFHRYYEVIADVAEERGLFEVARRARAGFEARQ